jgi:hypothetical protein
VVSSLCGQAERVGPWAGVPGVVVRGNDAGVELGT